MVDLSYLKRRTVLLKAVIYSLSNKCLDCGPKFWEIPLAHWEIPPKEGSLGANPIFQKTSRLGENPAKRNPAYRKFTVCLQPRSPASSLP